jgi:hypothetical protein
VTENEKYTEYVKCVAGTRITMLSLVSGFTFSSMTIFLEQFSNPSNFASQLFLLFLVVLFDLSLFLLAWQTIIMIGTWNVQRAPEHAKWELSLFNLLLIVVFILWGWSGVLMFLLKNLIFLTLVSGVLWLLVIIAIIALLHSTIKRLGWSVRAEMKNLRSRQLE